MKNILLISVLGIITYSAQAAESCANPTELAINLDQSVEVDYSQILSQRSSLQDLIVKATFKYCLLHYPSLVKKYGLPRAGGEYTIDSGLLTKAYFEIKQLALQSGDWSTVLKDIHHNYIQSPWYYGVWIIEDEPSFKQISGGFELLLYNFMQIEELLHKVYEPQVVKEYADNKYLKGYTVFQRLCHEGWKICFPIMEGTSQYRKFYDTFKRNAIRDTSNQAKELFDKIVKNTVTLEEVIKAGYPIFMPLYLSLSSVKVREGLLHLAQQNHNESNDNAKKAAYKAIARILKNQLKLTTKYGLISESGMISSNSLPEDIWYYIALFTHD